MASAPSSQPSAAVLGLGAVAAAGAALLLARSLPARSAALPSAPSAKYDLLADRLREISQLEGISGLISWDEMVMMPPGAAEARGKQKAALAGVVHEKSTDAVLGALIKALAKAEGSGDFSAHQEAVIRIAARDYKFASSIPMKLAKETAELESSAMQAWAEARKASDFGMFAPSLQRWVELSREKARLIDPSRPAYDVLLEKFEPGMTSARIDEIFSELRDAIIPLIKEIKGGTRPDGTFLSTEVGVEKQEVLTKQISQDLGFDTSKGRIDVSLHPFTGGSHPTEVRITTRYKVQDMREGLMGTIHETGHALYEQGRNLEYDGLPVNAALSMGMHESQSLLWERMVALSKDFSAFLLPKILEFIPELSGPNATPEGLYGKLNQISEPSLIRTESDEVTYPVHVIIRYEIEKALIEGSMQVADVPTAWNSKMKDYLGDLPDSDANGCLQDIHWSAGAFGYFPTYTLGAMYACQIFNTAAESLPGIRTDIKAGKFAPLKEWLNTNIHAAGSLYKSGDDLMLAVTGKPLDVSMYVGYLRKKYHGLYQVSA